MKKSIIAIAVFPCIFLCGCGQSQPSTLNNLSSHIQSCIHTVEGTSTNEVASVSPSIDFDANSTATNLQTYKATSYQNMLHEENLRQDIFTISNSIQSCIKNTSTLSQSKLKALQNIGANLKEYSTQLEQTKPIVKEKVYQISTALQSQANIDIEETATYYLALNNSMNDRNAYLSNLYSNLQAAYNIICCCPQEDNTCNTCQQENNIQQAEQQSKSKKNIDTFKNSAKQPPNVNFADKTIPPAVTNQYGYNYGYYSRGTFNPDRNTDSFYPRVRNIDTYRYNPTAYNQGYYQSLPQNTPVI